MPTDCHRLLLLLLLLQQQQQQLLLQQLLLQQQQQLLQQQQQLLLVSAVLKLDIVNKVLDRGLAHASKELGKKDGKKTARVTGVKKLDDANEAVCAYSEIVAFCCLSLAD
jgi:hypothetical protein